MNSKWYKEQKFDTWAELRDYLIRLYDNPLSYRFVFRGHRDADWSLTSSLERVQSLYDEPAPLKKLKEPWNRKVESEMIHHFDRAIDHYKNTVSKPEDTLHKLALMQHYGAPTRLLDVTSSPFIAAFFALQDVTNKSDAACIWKIDLSVIDESNAQNLNIKKGDRFKETQRRYNSFSYKSLYDKPMLGFSFLDKPDIRPFMQQGGFLFSLDQNISIEDKLKKYSTINSNFAVKLVLDTQDSANQKTGLRDLMRMNVKNVSLFPGMDGYCRDMMLNQFLSICH